MLILGAHPLRQIKQRGEASFQRRIAINLAADVADDPAKSRPQELELAPGALELMSVGIAADHDGGALRQAQIALAQRHTVALGEPDELGDVRSLESKIPKRKKARPNTRLSCKVEYFIETTSACLSGRSAFSRS